MSTDLRLATVFRRESILLSDDGLIFLDHQGHRDRVHKLLFDRVDGVLVWKTYPWIRMLIIALIFGIPIVLLLISDPEDTVVVNIILAAVMLMLELRYVILRKTFIRVNRDGVSEDLFVIEMPGKIRTFVSRLRINIATAQRREEKRLVELRDGRLEDEKEHLLERAETTDVAPETD